MIYANTNQAKIHEGETIRPKSFDIWPIKNKSSLEYISGYVLPLQLCSALAKDFTVIVYFIVPLNPEHNQPVLHLGELKHT